LFLSDFYRVAKICFLGVFYGFGNSATNLFMELILIKAAKGPTEILAAREMTFEMNYPEGISTAQNG